MSAAPSASTFDVGEIEVPSAFVGEVLRCVMHTIVLCRAFGRLRPAEGVITFLDLPFSKCEDASIDRLVDDKSALLSSEILSRRKASPVSTLSRVELTLSWRQPASRGHFWSMSPSKESPFEHWVVSLRNPPPQPTQPMAIRGGGSSSMGQSPRGGVSSSASAQMSSVPRREREALAEALRGVLGRVLAVVSERREHLPSHDIRMLQDDASILPYHLDASLVPEAGERAGTLLGTFVDLIRTPLPM